MLSASLPGLLEESFQTVRSAPTAFCQCAHSSKCQLLGHSAGSPATANPGCGRRAYSVLDPPNDPYWRGPACKDQSWAADAVHFLSVGWIAARTGLRA